MKGYDCSGWATRSGIKCADGRTIMPDAFSDQDGQIVPLVWQHQHDGPENVLGHALLKSRDGDIYTYCKFNDTENGKLAKSLVEHGDITSFSIYANKLKQNGGNVIHGAIREVSLVLAGANPGALIDFPILAHGEYAEDEGIIYNNELIHANDNEEEEEKPEPKKEEAKEEKKEEMADKTVKDVFDELTEEQKKVVYFMIGQAIEDAGGGSEEEEVKHNVFEGDNEPMDYISHADMQGILKDAKKLGSMKDAVEAYLGEGGVLMHANGITESTGNQTYFVNDPDMLFPEYKNLTNQPIFIERDRTWVSEVMNGAKHTPFSRIKSLFADITEDEARARGYMKGKQKKDEVFSLLKRTTDPQTVYKKQKMDRDDVIDITDFDVISWIKGEMRFMLDEEIARAALIGDGRLSSSDDKISEDHIRPIATDADLFTIKKEIVVNEEANEDGTVKQIIKEAIKARKDYKGSGTPTFFTTEDMLNAMLLLEDGLGYPLYKSEAELATRLRVKKIVTVPVMENSEYLAIIVNMADYTFGADKGGSVNMFDDFDIDYNQMKYLIETRCSGALTKPYSAIVLKKAPR